MNNKGFTLVEVLTVVVIVGVLTSVALPMYTRSVERSRATEAMTAIKAYNDAIYAYYVSKDECPTKLSQLIAAVGGTRNEAETTLTTKYFKFSITSKTTAKVPGTDCYGVLANRVDGGKYRYKMWHPYRRGVSTQVLECAPETATDKTNIALCESIGYYQASSSSM